MTWHQIRSLSHRRRLLGDDYIDQLVALGPIAYWPLNEASGSVARCLVNSAQNGTHVGVTLANDITGPFGTPAPFFDGTNDYVNIYSATFAAAFNGHTGTAAAWCRVYDSGVWSDSTVRYISNIRSAVTNRYSMRKEVAADTLKTENKAGGSEASKTHSPITTTDWFHLAITWSDETAADELNLYVNGVASGPASKGLGTYSGVGLLSANTIIGAYDTGPTLTWHGWMSHHIILDYVLPATTIAAMANP